MSVTLPDRVCGRLGCNREAGAVVHDPEKGEVVVCWDDVDGREVIRLA